MNEPVTPLYPSAVYSHQEGDSIGSGFVYRGKLMPQMRGKYIFHDRTTGRIFYSDLSEMLAARGCAITLAAIHEIQIMYKSPYDTAAKRLRNGACTTSWPRPSLTKVASRNKAPCSPALLAAVGGWRGTKFPRSAA